MKLKPGYMTHKVGNEVVMVGIKEGTFKGVIKLNETANRIVELLKDDTTIEKIEKVIASEYDDVDFNTIKDEIKYIIDSLDKVGIIEW